MSILRTMNTYQQKIWTMSFAFILLLSQVCLGASVVPSTVVLSGQIRSLGGTRISGAYLKLASEGSSRTSNTFGVWAWAKPTSSVLISSSILSSSSTKSSSSSEVSSFDVSSSSLSSSEEESSSDELSSSSEFVSSRYPSFAAQTRFNAITGDLEFNLQTTQHIRLDAYTAKGGAIHLFNQQVPAGSFRLSAMQNESLRKISGVVYLRLQLASATETYSLNVQHGKILAAYATDAVPTEKKTVSTKSIALADVAAQSSIDVIHAQAAGFVSADFPIMDYQQGDLGTLYLQALPDPVKPALAQVSFVYDLGITLDISFVSSGLYHTAISSPEIGDSLIFTWATSPDISVDSVLCNGVKVSMLRNSIRTMIPSAATTIEIKSHKLDLQQKVTLTGDFDASAARVEVLTSDIDKDNLAAPVTLVKSSLASICVTPSSLYLLTEVSIGSSHFVPADFAPTQSTYCFTLSMDQDTTLHVKTALASQQLAQVHFNLSPGLGVAPSFDGVFTLQAQIGKPLPIEIQIPPSWAVTALRVNGDSLALDSLCDYTGHNLLCNVWINGNKSIQIEGGPATIHHIEFPQFGLFSCSPNVPYLNVSVCPNDLWIPEGMFIKVTPYSPYYTVPVVVTPTELMTAMLASRGWYPHADAVVQGSYSHKASWILSLLDVQPQDRWTVDQRVLDIGQQSVTLLNDDVAISVLRPGKKLVGFEYNGVKTVLYDASNWVRLLREDNAAFKPLFEDSVYLPAYTLQVAASIGAGDGERLRVIAAWNDTEALAGFQLPNQSFVRIEIQHPTKAATHVSLQGVVCTQYTSFDNVFTCPVLTQAEYGIPVSQTALYVDYTLATPSHATARFTNTSGKDFQAYRLSFLGKTPQQSLALDSVLYEGDVLTFERTLSSPGALPTGLFPDKIRVGTLEFPYARNWSWEVNLAQAGVQPGDPILMEVLGHKIPKAVRIVDADANVDFWDAAFADSWSALPKDLNGRIIAISPKNAILKICPNGIVSDKAATLDLLGTTYALTNGVCTSVNMDPLLDSTGDTINLPLQVKYPQSKVLRNFPVQVSSPYPIYLGLEGYYTYDPIKPLVLVQDSRISEGTGEFNLCALNSDVAQYGSPIFPLATRLQMASQSAMFTCYKYNYSLILAPSYTGDPQILISVPPLNTSVNDSVKLKLSIISDIAGVTLGGRHSGDTISLAGQTYPQLCLPSSFKDWATIAVPSLSTNSPTKVNLTQSSCTAIGVNVPAQGDSLRIEVSTAPVKQITMALDPTLLSKVVSVFYSDFNTNARDTIFADGTFKTPLRQGYSYGQVCLQTAYDQWIPSSPTIGGLAYDGYSPYVGLFCARLDPTNLTDAHLDVNGKIWVKAQVETVPSWQVKLVSDHPELVKSWKIITASDSTTAPDRIYFDRSSQLSIATPDSVMIDSIYLGSGNAITSNFNFPFLLTSKIPLNQNGQIELRVVLHTKRILSFAKAANANSKLASIALLDSYSDIKTTIKDMPISSYGDGYYGFVCTHVSAPNQRVDSILIHGRNYPANFSIKNDQCTSVNIRTLGSQMSSSSETWDVDASIISEQQMQFSLANATNVTDLQFAFKEDTSATTHLYADMPGTLCVKPSQGYVFDTISLGDSIFTFNRFHFISNKGVCIDLPSVSGFDPYAAVKVSARPARSMTLKPFTGSAFQLSLDGCKTMLPWGPDKTIQVPEWSATSVCVQKMNVTQSMQAIFGGMASYIGYSTPVNDYYISTFSGVSEKRYLWDGTAIGIQIQ